MTEELSTEQRAFSKWLATPKYKRVPATQKELAAELGVADKTLKNWKQLPAIWQAFDDATEDELREMVPWATAVYEKGLKHMRSVDRVSYEIARDILKQWGERRRHSGGDIAKTLVDLYKKYFKD